MFPQIALGILQFPYWLLSISSFNWRAIIRLWINAPCYFSSVVAEVTSYSSYPKSTLISIFLYSFIVQPFSGCVILKMTSRLFKNNIKYNFTVRCFCHIFVFRLRSLRLPSLSVHKLIQSEIQTLHYNFAFNQNLE